MWSWRAHSTSIVFGHNTGGDTTWFVLNDVAYIHLDKTSFSICYVTGASLHVVGPHP